MHRRHRLLAAISAPLLVTACGGGGGGGFNLLPTIVAATLLQSGPSPAAGDRLLLLMSEAIQIAAGSTLDDGDFALTGGTLGNVTVAPILFDARTVQVTLGSGTVMVPGTTSIALAATNDAIIDLGGSLGTGGTPLALSLGDGGAPTIQPITLELIDAVLNGSGPAGGTLQVPRTGFAIDVTWFDGPSGINADLTVITADVAVTVDGQSRPSGSNLADAMTRLDGANSASFVVRSGISFPAGNVTIALYGVDGSGMPGPPRSFAFRTVSASDDIRPLERGQTWHLSLDRDIENFQLDVSGALPSVLIIAGANSSPDAVDVLRVLGLQSTNPLPNVTPGVDSNAFVLARFRETLLAELAKLFTDVDIAFTFDSPGTFPAGQSSVGYGNLSFSRICLAGAASTSPTGTLGAALYDPNNQTQNDDCIDDFNGQRLGVFLHTFAHVGLRAGGTSTFRQTFVPFIPQIVSGNPPASGVPIGEDGQDADRLLGNRQDPRRDQIDNAIFGIARAAAVVIAHECGHSMGLVANGAMPAGLYGDDAVNFPTNSSSASLHIETPGLFPGGAQNVMSPSVAYDAALHPSTGFNSLNLAYLRERALYDKQ